MLASVGMAMDGVARKFTSIVDMGSSNIVAQCDIIAACMNVREYAAPSSSASSSIHLS